MNSQTEMNRAGMGDPRQWPERGLYAAWLGHSTVLLKIDGVTVLTDPVFSDTVGVKLGSVNLGANRLSNPAIGVGALPAIDLVLLSHAHMDHFDLPSLRALQNSHTTVVTAARTSDLLRNQNWGSIRELRWDEQVVVNGITVRGLEVNHWGARWQFDMYRGYNGYFLSAGRRRIVFAGDTAATPAFRRLRGFGPVDLAIMPIGAYDPWVWFHSTPEQAWSMSKDAGAAFVLPVHHQTFRLSREPAAEPLERLYEAAGPDSDRIVIQHLGQEVCLN